MGLSFHEYEGYHDDVRATYGKLFASLGLMEDLSDGMLRFASSRARISFGIEAQMPEMYLEFPGIQQFTIITLLEAAGEKDDFTVHVLFPSTPSQRATARLVSWRPFLAKHLPLLVAGDFTGIQARSAEEEAYEYKLRSYVSKHCGPHDHATRARLWEPGWREFAEQFLRESGGKLD